MGFFCLVKNFIGHEAAAFEVMVKAFVGDRCLIHLFRHSIHGRLRAVECPADIVDQIRGYKFNCWLDSVVLQLQLRDADAAPPKNPSNSAPPLLLK